MVGIICIDKNKGMMFNNRRQSKDRNLITHILKKVDNNTLWITSFSQDIFNSSEIKNIIVDDMFWEKIGKDEYCFIENIELTYIIEKIDTLIVYNWNRAYPADKYFDISIENEWTIQSEEEFKGFSHKKITEKIYIRNIK